MRTLIAVFIGCAISTSVFARVPGDSPADARSAQADDALREKRIRPQDSRLVELLQTGVARSATLRDIVNRLEAGKLIVYVSLSPTLRPGIAGKLTWISSAGTYRYVKATINSDQMANQMIATLAHELQHALEVSADDSVVDQRSLLGLYKRIGRPSLAGASAGWETTAAQETGLQVRRELIAAAAAASAMRAGDNTRS
jgi:hypothetical protein